MPYDLFDFLGIEFDPPESPKRVNDAFTLKIRDIQGLRSTSSDPLEQSEYAKQLAFLAEMKREVLAADEKQFTLRFSQLAAERTQQSLVALAEMLQIEKMVYSTKPVVTKAKVNELRKSFRLSAAKVEQGLAAAGFTVAELPITMPDFPPNAPRIVAEMAALREMPDPRSSPQQVYDLYSFCAYLEGTPGEGARYQRMSSPELQVLLDKYAVQYAGHIDPLGKCCASLAALCKSYIVNNDTNRQAFELYLQYRSSELTKLFASFKHIPKGRLRNPTLAEAMIAVIVKELGNISGVNEIALAIYNQEADLLRDPEGPYLPHEILFRLKCAHCLESVVFPDEETAQRINRCPNCGNPLYTTCPQCQTAIIALAARCPNPSCGYILARTGRFQEHVHQAQDALLQGNLVMAREQLVKASQTNPALHDTLTSLEQRITQEEDLFIAQAARTPCPLDKQASRLVELLNSNIIELHLQVAGEIPANVSAFWLASRRKSSADQEAPWAESQEVGQAQDILCITVANYRQQGKILLREIPGDFEAFYVTFFTAYQIQGRQVFSAPYKLRLDRPLLAEIIWQILPPPRLSLGREGRLQLEIHANRPASFLPKLLIYCCPPEHHLLTPQDRGGELLLELPAVTYPEAKRVRQVTYPLNKEVTTALQRHQGWKLFLFTAASDPREQYTPKWAPNFRGRIS